MIMNEEHAASVTESDRERAFITRSNTYREQVGIITCERCFYIRKRKLISFPFIKSKFLTSRVPNSIMSDPILPGPCLFVVSVFQVTGRSLSLIKEIAL